MHADIELLKQFYWRVVEGRPRSFMKIKKKYILNMMKRSFIDF